MNLKNKTLLIITDGFPNKDNSSIDCQFVKDQVDYISDYFKEVIVICPKAYFPKRLMNFRIFPNIWKKRANYKNYSYKNVSVFYPNYVSLPFKFFKKLIPYFSYIVTNSALKKHRLKFDLIHAHFTLKSGFVGKKLKQKYGVPFILTAHESKNWFLELYHSDSVFINNIWSVPDLLIRVNQQDVDKLKKINENTQFLPNGYNDNIFFVKNKIDCKNKLQIPRNKKIILNVANYLIDQKNQLNLIHALSLLKDKRTDFFCYLIGSGKDEYLIKNEVQKLGLSNFIKVIGPKKPTEVSEYMSASDLFVFPSYSESFGIVQIEAMACGVPVVATINGGSEEIITDENIGVLLRDPNDFKGLCDQIDFALNKKWDSTYIIKKNMKYAHSNVIKEMIKIYIYFMNK